MIMIRYVSFLFALLFPLLLFAQRQYADTLYQPPIWQTAYDEDQGPVVFIDEGHHNFHTKDGRYRPFANLLERDGYQVQSYTGTFEMERLEKGKILVISNALHESNVSRWILPTPSAFSTEEIEVLKQWVHQGGSLFLIADHMPMAGGAEALAAAFGYTFYNGFASDTTKTGSDLFARATHTLTDCEITNGRSADERVDSIRSFTGQAFEAPQGAIPIIKCSEHWVSYQTDTAWQFNATTPVVAASEMFQGTYQEYGKGKLVLFGEAAMFSAQIAEVNGQKFKAGMNRENAPHNYQLLLNIIHWLDGKFD